MPLDEFLKSYTPGDDFTFEALRDAALAEYEKDQTAWRAAVSTRDEKISTTESALTRAQAAAWEAYQNAPAGDTTTSIGVEPDENAPEAIRARVFKPVERK